MSLPRLISAAGLCLAGFQAALLGGPVPSNKPVAYPAWWFEFEVISRLPGTSDEPSWPLDYPAADDYAVANQGQLKFIFFKAAEKFTATLPNGAGTDINNQVLIWEGPPAEGVSRDDFAVVNQGQLKAVASMVYRRLRQSGYFGAPLKNGEMYPWGENGIEDAYAAVNLGQIKHVFSFFSGIVYFDAYLADTDLDGLPDGWELERGLDRLDPGDAANTSGGLTYLELYQQSLALGSDPTLANAAGLVVYSP